MARGMDVREALSALGLSPGAAMDDVKSAYRQRAMRCHPDTAHGAPPEEFHRITAAYNCLLRSGTHEAHSRAQYAAGRVVYASGLGGARGGRTATMVWGVGLGLGGMLFAGILLLGRTIVPRTVYAGPTRRVEPTADAAKRERIASLLMEKAGQRGGGGGGGSVGPKQP